MVDVDAYLVQDDIKVFSLPPPPLPHGPNESAVFTSNVAVWQLFSDNAGGTQEKDPATKSYYWTPHPASITPQLLADRICDCAISKDNAMDPLSPDYVKLTWCPPSIFLEDPDDPCAREVSPPTCIQDEESLQTHKLQCQGQVKEHSGNRSVNAGNQCGKTCDSKNASHKHKKMHPGILKGVRGLGGQGHPQPKKKRVRFAVTVNLD